MKKIALFILVGLMALSLSFAEEAVDEDYGKTFVMQFNINSCRPIGASVLCYVHYGFLRDEFCPNLDAMLRQQEVQRKANEELAEDQKAEEKEH